MPSYCYVPLSSESNQIRLLRLMPHADDNADIHCELFEYAIGFARGNHLYDALSYVWGDPDKTQPILIHGTRFNVTRNLHAALSQLRNHSMERVLWIDAICIDQNNQLEKEHQIQYMAAIYGQANRTLVWLGEAADDSDLVFEQMRSAEGQRSTSVVDKVGKELAGLALLHRPWFRRIWILQEVAAARNVVIMCGSQRIDGYAFCLGIDWLVDSYMTPLELRSLVRPVIYLIRESIFRPDYLASSLGRSTLDICPLSGLVDMYHAHDATKCHDKVFALLGMCSDDLSKGHLSPNYGVPWAELLQRLVKHVISDDISVETWGFHQAAVVKSTGCILGEVVAVETNPIRGDRITVQVRIEDRPGQLQRVERHITTWNLQVSAVSIRMGDLICLLQGASKPTIVRLHKDYFTIVMVTVTILEEIRRTVESFEWPTEWLRTTLPVRDFLVVWDWQRPSEQYPEEYETWMRTRDWTSRWPGLEHNVPLVQATRLWHIVLILGDLAALSGSRMSLKMEESGREAVKHCELAIKHNASSTIIAQHIQDPLRLAQKEACNNKNEIADLLLTDDMVDLALQGVELTHGPRPFTWAVEGDHEAVVEVLLQSTNEASGSLLLKAASRGYEALVRLLLKRSELDFEAETNHGESALWLAADGGHENIVRLLLRTGKVDIGTKHRHSQQTLLSRAAENGYEAVVRLLLEFGNIDVDEEDTYGDTPLLRAASGGHEAVVRLLLDTGKANIERKDRAGQTALSLAAHEGHEAVVRLLLDTGKANVYTRDNLGYTPLERAVGQQEAIELSPLELSRLEDEWGYVDQSEEARSKLKNTIALLQAASDALVEGRDSF